MSPHAAAEVVAILGGGDPRLYLYQIGSRKKKRVRYKVKIAIVLVVVLCGGRAHPAATEGPGSGGLPHKRILWAGVRVAASKGPRQDRRYPKSCLARVVARDLTSKGLKWTPQSTTWTTSYRFREAGTTHLETSG